MKRAFSLVELSIVLVILGLLVGGVLSGQALIKAATLRKQLNQITTIQTGMNTFKDKYFYFPGDIPNATSFFGTTDPSGDVLVNGNGDGIITSTDFTGAHDCFNAWADIRHTGAGGYEGVYFFQHLLMAGLFQYTPGTFADQHPHATFDGSHHILMGCSMALGATPMSLVPPDRRFWSPILYLPWDGTTDQSEYNVFNGSFSGIDNDDARQIDGKIDDGKPSTGAVWAMSGCANGLTDYASATSCTDILAIKMN